ncbi:Pao retrotransposon peptidase [Nesidiocoris tenuis]|uniref:Pao retrotransposon peptidase n=3 Tax=Nesidiocoris tenuis TaxID=355587 RepID=A0ABN7AC66_9HEMI|nr:Pao retrotransposon peptidase [Nesidiocoris tenuis]
MLATARAYTKGRHGLEAVKIFLDLGSQGTFISQKCVDRLGLSLANCYAPIFGLGQVKAGISKGLVELALLSNYAKNFKVSIQAFVVPTITHCPRVSVGITAWPHLEGYTLADDECFLDQEVDILLGAEWYARVVIGAPIVGQEGAPDLIETVFGYCLLGRVTADTTPEVTAMCTTLQPNVDALLRKFWEIEESPRKQILSREEVDAENFYLETIDRVDGHYIVRLPFLPSSPELGESYSFARRRFASLENKLNKNPLLRAQYNKFMSDYLEQGHMEITNSPPEGVGYYVPHHCIYRHDESFSRFRVVFDCSMKTSNGTSLNDVMNVGPKLQQNICDVLIRFRLHNVCLVADVKQMYRCIGVASADQDHQRIFWRFSPADSLSEFRLTTVTYGNAAAPFLALRTMKQLVYDEGSQFPMAAKALLNNTFVDDTCISVPTVHDALKLQAELVALLAKGKFSLKKWLSNRPQLLKNIPEEDRAMKTEILSFRGDDGLDPGTNILGLSWNPATDQFSFKIEPLKEMIVTKRTILSEVSRLYDPLGFLCPVTFYGKWLIQHLWSSGLGWDETPSEEIVIKWKQYHSELPLLSQVQIPRCVELDSAVSVQLHGFCDSSQRGYAGVVYLRNINKNGKITCSLLVAKSKVAPLKRISLPRLELCGAVLVTDLLHYAKEMLKDHVSIQSTVVWCDSMVSLQWIKASPHKWKTFIANRVSQIHERLAPDCFRYVPSASNPSDIASRGALPMQFLSDRSWLSGPDWLIGPPEKWPKIPPLLKSEEVMAEAQIVSLPLNSEITPIESWLENYSSFTSLKRHTAFLLRYFKYLRDPHADSLLTGGLSTDELKLAVIRLVRFMQRPAFALVGPEPENLNITKRWKLVQKLLHSFWDRWRKDYLGGLQTRSKWTKEFNNLKVDDLVIMKEPNLSPSQWKMARITKVLPGEDGIVRVAEVKTAQGTFTRSVRKLCPLPLA